MERADLMQAGTSIPCTMRSSLSPSSTSKTAEQGITFSSVPTYLSETNRYYDPHSPFTIHSDPEYIHRYNYIDSAFLSPIKKGILFRKTNDYPFEYFFSSWNTGSSTFSGAPIHHSQYFSLSYENPNTHPFINEWRHYGTRVPALPDASRQVYQQYFPTEGR